MAHIDDRTAIIANPYANRTNIGNSVVTLFSDNFSGISSGDLPAATKWGIALGSPDMDPTVGSQWYQHSPNNVFVDGSGVLNLVVTANGGGTSVTPATGNYVSARISTFVEPSGPPAAPGQMVMDWTQTRAGFQPFSASWGTLTVVAKQYPAQGLWPAIWMYGGPAKHWPECMEIDVSEMFGSGAAAPFNNMTRCFSNVLGPRQAGDYLGADWDLFTGQVGAAISPSAINVADGNWHTYQCAINSTWTTITITVDGTAIGTSPITQAAWLSAASASGFPNAQWNFGPNTPLGIVLNCAVGGSADAGGVGFPSSGLVLPYTAMKVQSVTFTQP